ncbi:MAG: Threonine synthase [Bacteroidota bacterium]|jgi:threonine synthase
MHLYSTVGQSPKVSLEEAIFRGLPPDNGLYMLEKINPLSKRFIDNIHQFSIQEIAKEVCLTLLGEDFSDQEIEGIVERAINFEAPVKNLDSKHSVLELFHGPSMAFKDFGARFMASIMSHYLKKSNKEIHILVATSGDTGGAVALGFYDVPGIKVTILYPKGKVSDIQEKQLTTLGKNITALEIDGTFDDCQRLVKQAFLDSDLRTKYNLASANSINISRLIPQSFYYFSAFSQARKSGIKDDIVFSVPSGNFGNLSAGLIAYQMGLPVKGFVAATNINKVVPDYLKEGIYSPKPSTETYSNAMDVGNPSNFPRLQLLAGKEWDKIKTLVKGYFTTDQKTLEVIKETKENFDYLVCPHTAVGLDGLNQYFSEYGSENTHGIVLATAHYAKFLPTMEKVIKGDLPIPEKLSELLNKEKIAENLSAEFSEFKSYLLSK